MQPLIECTGFQWNGFQIPAFSLRPGEMVRIWVQIVPNTDKLTGYDFVRKFKAALAKGKNIHGLVSNAPVASAGDLHRNRIHQLFGPKTAAGYLAKEDLSPMTSALILDAIQIGGQEKIRALGQKRKLLSILASLEKEAFVAFDYFGLGPVEEELLTAFVQMKIEEGKAVIGFDNLYYLTEKEPFESIHRVIVKRTEEPQGL